MAFLIQKGSKMKEKNQVLPEYAQKSLYGDLLYFFERNPKFRLKQSELVAILGLLVHRLENRLANNHKQESVYII